MSKFLYLFIGMTSAIGGVPSFPSQIHHIRWLINKRHKHLNTYNCLILSSVVAILFHLFERYTSWIAWLWVYWDLCSGTSESNSGVLTLQNFLVVHQTLPHQMTYQNQVGIHHPNNNYDHWFSFSLQVDSKYCLELFSLKVFLLWLSLTCSSLISSSSMSSSISSQWLLHADVSSWSSSSSKLDNSDSSPGLRMNCTACSTFYISIHFGIPKSISKQKIELSNNSRMYIT